MELRYGSKRAYTRYLNFSDQLQAPASLSSEKMKVSIGQDRNGHQTR